jgi:2-polyprenyl-3-methyl-5-hydroxy-6-metoxy-1,4-benzoquinol methylase
MRVQTLPGILLKQRYIEGMGALHVSGTACESSLQMNDQQIIECWKRNSEPWTLAVREGLIRSRILVTDAAIEEAVLAQSPSTVLDIGCGEGWLVRKLASHGVDALGIDVVPELIASARREPGGRYEVMDYEALAEQLLPDEFDVCVCNFSLLGADATAGVFAAMPDLLAPGGALIVQTLHPWSACGELPYRDGWREGSWAGINADFGEPAPWFFRTMQSWMNLFLLSGLRIESILEPRHPDTDLPASVILTGATPR